ncbi:guanylate kinase [Candidatus Liberibacter sp.]|uniref:guanylate kinase n=1 Tax=Candidatus Liberibacter sp. TaxID=34022 RepID=UPI0015F68546|nr:guanylate kinase [Candidatus Liberibacter sp.]MBA5723730.1 guanylate kinase [Candidatus Liberibacter sp.]
MSLDNSSSIFVNRRGMMLVISSPSGVGKSTIADSILRSDKNFDISVSATTRSRRPNEVDGKDYHFLSLEQFEKLRDSNAFIEWAKVHGHFYGTLRDPIENNISRGRDMLFDIDWQGTFQLRKNMKSDIVSCFILPPTMRELHSRLCHRAKKTQESQKSVELRLCNAYTEIKKWNNYDYVIINDSLETSLRTLRSVIESERIRRQRIDRGISGFIKGLLQEKL